MGRAVSIFLLLLAGFTVRAEDEPAGEKLAEFTVDRHLFASSIRFDGKGRCQAVGGVVMKAWYVAGFPAEIPHFESCTTISSPTARGEVDIELSIVDKSNDRLLRVDGFLDLGIDGKASQAIDWDHLKVPEAGVYYFVIKIEGREVKRIPMRFSPRKGMKKKGR